MLLLLLALLLLLGLLLLALVLLAFPLAFLLALLFRLLRLLDRHDHDVRPALVGVLALRAVPAELGGLGDPYVDAREAVGVSQDGLSDGRPRAARCAGLQDQRVAGDAAPRVGDPTADDHLLP